MTVCLASCVTLFSFPTMSLRERDSVVLTHSTRISTRAGPTFDDDTSK